MWNWLKNRYKLKNLKKAINLIKFGVILTNDLDDIIYYNDSCAYILGKKFVKTSNFVSIKTIILGLEIEKVWNNRDIIKCAKLDGDIFYSSIDRYDISFDVKNRMYLYIFNKSDGLNEYNDKYNDNDNFDKIYQSDISSSKNILEDSERLGSFGYWKWYLKYDKILISNGFIDIYEIDSCKVITFEKFMNLNYVDDREMMTNTFNNCIEMENSFEMIYRLSCFDRIKYIYTRGEYSEDIKGSYIICVLQDITKQKITEIELIESKLLAEKSSYMKTSFVANVSHEIRTPINGIVGMTTLLKNTNLDEDQREYLDTIINSSDTLMSIINNILDLSRIEAGKILINNIDIDLNIFLNQIMEVFGRIIKDKGILFKIHKNGEVPDDIISDSVKMQQIISNLLNNSIKFTEYGSIILIVSIVSESEMEESNNDFFLKFEIRDTGIGISSENQNKLFKPFEQVDNSTTRRYGGTGLGLSICKNLVDVMNGKIGLISNEGIGTNVWFTIPLVRGNKIKEDMQVKRDIQVKRDMQVKSDMQVKRDMESKDKINRINIKIKENCQNGHECGSKKKDPLIIIVEDNIVNQIVLRKMIEHIGYKNIVIYDNGLSVYQELSKEGDLGIKPDIIFMDIQMSKMDGYKCTERLRAAGINIPIIAVTANCISGEKEKCEKIGMNDFLSKPIQIEELKSIISKFI